MHTLVAIISQETTMGMELKGNQISLPLSSGNGNYLVSFPAWHLPYLVQNWNSRVFSPMVSTASHL